MVGQREALTRDQLEQFRAWGNRLVDEGPEVVAGSQQAAMGYAMQALCNEVDRLREQVDGEQRAARELRAKLARVRAALE